MILLAPAKVNLYLEITGKDNSDGYHYIDSIFDPIALYDVVEIEKNITGRINVSVKGNHPEVKKKDNIVYKAAKLFFEKYKRKNGVNIKLSKNIPHGAGLGGGSSDAAAVLTGLNSLFKTGLTISKMRKYASALGSDVPFFIKPHTSRVSGKGEKITRIKRIGRLWYVLVKPKVIIPTESAYKWFDREGKSKKTPLNKGIKYITDSIKKVDKSGLIMYNCFEKVLFRKHVKLKYIKGELMKTAPLNAGLSGSGATVFAVFETKEKALLSYNKMKKKFRNYFVCLTHSL